MRRSPGLSWKHHDRWDTEPPLKQQSKNRLRNVYPASLSEARPLDSSVIRKRLSRVGKQVTNLVLLIRDHIANHGWQRAFLCVFFTNASGGIAVWVWTLNFYYPRDLFSPTFNQLSIIIRWLWTSEFELSFFCYFSVLSDLLFSMNRINDRSATLWTTEMGMSQVTTSPASVLMVTPKFVNKRSCSGCSAVSREMNALMLATCATLFASSKLTMSGLNLSYSPINWLLVTSTSNRVNNCWSFIPSLRSLVNHTHKIFSAY